MAKKDYYKILGVNENATVDEIKRAYRKLAKKYHPDLHPDDKKNEARFKEINEAHDILTDPKKRADYDRLRKGGFEHGFEGFGYAYPGGINFQDLGFDIGGIENVFGEMFGWGKSKRPQSVKGRDIDYEVTIDFNSAIRGAELKITINRRGGRETLSIKIPPGVKDGSKIRVAGKGNEGIGGGAPGDLYIVTRIRPHPYFKREGDDIYLDVPVTVSEAAMGGKVTVPTIDGETTFIIPPGTQSGQKLKLKGKGVRHIKGGERGDMYIVVKVVVPEKLNPRTIELLKELESAAPYKPREGLWQ